MGCLKRKKHFVGPGIAKVIRIWSLGLGVLGVNEGGSLQARTVVLSVRHSVRSKPESKVLGSLFPAKNSCSK